MAALFGVPRSSLAVNLKITKGGIRTPTRPLPYCSERASKRIMPGFDSQRSGPDLLIPGLTIVVAENIFSVFLLDKAIEAVFVVFAGLIKLLFPKSPSLVDHASSVCGAEM
jgi:hypothetical protein